MGVPVGSFAGTDGRDSMCTHFDFCVGGGLAAGTNKHFHT